MKQTLNEQVSRIKSIMGCKGTINEDDSNCVNLDSEQGMQMINNLAASINSLGLTNDDITYTESTSPEVTDIKNKVTDMMKPILKSATSEQYDSMIKDVRDLRKQRRQEKKNQKSAAAPGLQPDGPTAPPLQEQGESLWASQVMPFLASIPTGVWIIIGAWIILRLLRCKIYEFEFSVMRCANGGQRNIIVKLTELLMLDFRNFFEFDDNLWNCGED
jgi:hypothetical protein